MEDIDYVFLDETGKKIHRGQTYWRVNRNTGLKEQTSNHTPPDKVHKDYKQVFCDFSLECEADVFSTGVLLRTLLPQKWEYNQHTYSLTDANRVHNLKVLGNRGWEVICTLETEPTYITLLLKRPI